MIYICFVIIFSLSETEDAIAEWHLFPGEPEDGIARVFVQSIFQNLPMKK